MNHVRPCEEARFVLPHVRAFFSCLSLDRRSLYESVQEVDDLRWV